MEMLTKQIDKSRGSNEQFVEVGSGCYVYSAVDCPNTGVIIGERGILVIDSQASQDMSLRVLAKIREVSDKPIKSLILTHFHADSRLGAEAFSPGEIIASDLTRRMIEVRASSDVEVLKQRDLNFASDTTEDEVCATPTMSIASSMAIDLGALEVRVMHLGRGHTMGDLVVWVPGSSVLYAGGLVSETVSPYCGDGHLADWPRALERIGAFRPSALVPACGRVATGSVAIANALETTREYVFELKEHAANCVEQGMSLKDTFQFVQNNLSNRFSSLDDFQFNLPLNVARAYDEALGLDQPQIWTLERFIDLVDAINGTSFATPKTAQIEEEISPVEELVTDAAAGEPPEDLAVSFEEPNAPQPDLVSDTDFAASLLDDDLSVDEEEKAEMTADLNEEILPKPPIDEPVQELSPAQ